MAAEFEEIVVTADLFDVEYVGPYLRQRHFDRALWRFIFTAEPGVLIRFGQGLAVEFAVSRERQAVQSHVSGRDQSVRQPRVQILVQIADLDRLDCGKPGDQTAVAHQHHAFAHRGVSAQRRFDFPEFYTHAAQFYLIIIAPQVFDIAVRQPASEVAGAVHPRMRFIAERVVKELC
ncbi:hypothetical protein D3C81_1291380 [compost metagenome]